MEVQQAKYLGVTITSDLRWDTHIANITNKASKTLGFIRRNLKIKNSRIKKAAYKALVRPVLEYASPVWDPHTDNNIKSIEKIQRRAARWIMGNYRKSASVDSMLKILQWPTLETRRKRTRLTTFFKYHHGLIKIDSKNKPTVRSRPRHNTRQTHSLQYDIPSHRTKYRQQCFFPRTIPQWNNLPAEVATAPTLASFQSRVATTF